MRFHADPLYGTWSPNTAVVSIGAERRCVEAGQDRTRQAHITVLPVGIGCVSTNAFLYTP